MSDDTRQAREPETRRPVLRIVKGNPTPEEIAALVTVLSARAAAGGEEQPPRRSEWARHERRMRRPVHPSPGGWRASAFPR
jgi:Acyl-CoA carboxylase epsilon subunit